MVSHEGLHPPKYLETDLQHYVGHFLLTDTPASSPPSASRLVSSGNVDFKLPLPHESLGLRRQLNEVNDPKWMQDIEGVDKVDSLPKTQAYVAASVTSIPLLDVVRGFHRRLDGSEPMVAGPSTLTGEWAVLDGLDHVSVLLHHAELNHEAARLVIQKLFKHDVKHVTVLQGKYYKGVRRADIDQTQLTSHHAPFLQAIGEMCVWA
jgi:hypothetical protein